MISFFLLPDVAIITGTIIDVNLGEKEAVRMLSPTLSLIWLTEVAIVMLATNVGVYGASKRINSMIKSLNAMNEV